MLDLGSACEDLAELGPKLDSQKMDSPHWRQSNPDLAVSAEDLEFIAPTPAPTSAEQRNGTCAAGGEPCRALPTTGALGPS
jgi:hypothetical protein